MLDMYICMHGWFHQFHVKNALTWPYALYTVRFLLLGKSPGIY